MTSGEGIRLQGRGHNHHKVHVKLHYFFKNLLFYSRAQTRQLKYRNDDQGILPVIGVFFQQSLPTNFNLMKIMYGLLTPEILVDISTGSLLSGN